jgi:hypothetical protein
VISGNCEVNFWIINVGMLVSFAILLSVYPMRILNVSLFSSSAVERHIHIYKHEGINPLAGSLGWQSGIQRTDLVQKLMNEMLTKFGTLSCKEFVLVSIVNLLL